MEHVGIAQGGSNISRGDAAHKFQSSWEEIFGPTGELSKKLARPNRQADFFDELRCKDLGADLARFK